MPRVHQAKIAPSPNDSKTVHNPLEGVESARQLDETVDQFLKRLPPASSSFVGPWIWVTNPDAEDKDEQSREDREEGDSFGARCSAILKDYSTAAARIESEMVGKAKGSITRKLTPLRTKLKEDLVNVAVEERCLCGKVLLQFTSHLTLLIHPSGCCFPKPMSSVVHGDWLQKA